MPTVAEEYDVVSVDTHAATRTMSLVAGRRSHRSRRRAAHLPNQPRRVQPSRALDSELHPGPCPACRVRVLSWSRAPAPTGRCSPSS